MPRCRAKIQLVDDRYVIEDLDQRIARLDRFYEEHGKMIRHNSTVRMSIGTFFLGVALATIQFRWEEMDLIALLSVLLALIFGLGVFWYFSRQTIKSLQRQIKIANSFYQLHEVETYDWIKVPGKTLIGIQIFFMGVLPALSVFTIALYLFANTDQSAQSSGAQLEIEAKILDSRPKRFDLPIQVTPKIRAEE